MKENVGRDNWNVALKGWDVFWYVQYFSTPGLPAGDWIFLALRTMQTVYYPIIGIIGVPVNLVTIVILSRGKCGLTKGVTYYLVAMAGADLLVIIFDVILRQIPIFYAEWFSFLWYVPICNLHAVFLYAVTDCSVWFTVAFTFDRLLAICFQKIKTRYCNQKTASVVLGTVTGLSCLKNIFWYFMFTGEYYLDNDPWFCFERAGVLYSQAWATVEFLHYFLTPVAAFVLILLFNVMTIRHILVTSRARRRLRAPDCQGGSKDPEMESRRKSVILLLVISANFIILWTSFMIYSIWIRLWWMEYITVMLHRCVQELGYVLQLMSCCTNTGIYAVTQKKFRAEFKNLVTFPFIKIAKLIKR